MNKQIVFFLIVFISFNLFHQKINAKKIGSDHQTVFDLKVNELCSVYKDGNFHTYKRGNLAMRRNTEFPIMVALKQGMWYQFVMVGDPSATKMEIKLGLEGVGDFITDKFKPQDTEEYWTKFSFICPRSGMYLLTFFQKGQHENMLAHVAILQHNNHTAEGTLQYKQ